MLFDSVAGGGQEFCSLPLTDYGSTYVGVCFRAQYEISRLRILLRAQAFGKNSVFSLPLLYQVQNVLQVETASTVLVP